MHIESGQRIPDGNDGVDARAGLQQSGQAGLTFAKHGADAFLHEGGKADELDGIAQALFGVQQDRAVRQVIPLPERLPEIPETSFHLPGLPATFVLFPALGEIAREEQERRQKRIGLIMIGLQT